ncbi:MAG: DUF4911 domain-containing protein [Proteobacteria bacterium]|nr:DUF4911 domain-containing protein [Desulfobulbaceae bacterium]MBU4151418.1 DUF4911 domain-containing protein [Pseudomonadota bacterium]MDP2104615.1 DUF4911 domain-containing protein [Desulfobulbaceae bacterium]
MTTEFGTILLKITPHRIGFIKFILEGYDGMALVSTVDSKSGSIIIRYPLSFHDNLTAIIADLSPLLFGEVIINQQTLTPNGLNHKQQNSSFTKLPH